MNTSIIFCIIFAVIFGLGLGYLIGILCEIIKNIKINREVKMKTIKEKLTNLNNEVLLKKSRISDSSIVEIQETMNKLKELIDNEVKRRAENLNRQEYKQE